MTPSGGVSTQGGDAPSGTLAELLYNTVGTTNIIETTNIRLSELYSMPRTLAQITVTGHVDILTLQHKGILSLLIGWKSETGQSASPEL